MRAEAVSPCFSGESFTPGFSWAAVRPRSDLPLRPYQERALSRILDAYLDDKQSVAISLPTGCGKTIIFLALARGVVEAGGRVLIVAHRDELILQPVEKLSLVWPGAPVPGIIKAERFEPDRPIVLAECLPAPRGLLLGPGRAWLGCKPGGRSNALHPADQKDQKGGAFCALPHRARRHPSSHFQAREH